MLKKSIKHLLLVPQQKFYNGLLIPNKYFATYRVDNANVMITTHEQAQVNPLLSKPNGDTFQHPTYVKTLCEVDNCESKLCKKPCGTPVENVDVGHATHSGTFSGARYISSKDSAGNERPEYIVPYKVPVENTTGGANINEEKTKNLNNNSEALNNVHMNASKQPTQKTNTDSNDPTNLN